MLLGVILPVLLLFSKSFLKFCIPELGLLEFGSQPSHLVLLLLELNTMRFIALLQLAF